MIQFENLLVQRFDQIQSLIYIKQLQLNQDYFKFELM